MKLAIDLDGVVFDFTSAMNRWAKEHHGEPEVLPTNWDWFQKWKQPAHFRAIMSNRDFWRTLEPYPDAMDGLAALHKLGHDITFITHRPMEADAGTDYALGYWELWHPLVMASGNKSLEAMKRDITWAVDDLPATVRQYHNAKIKAYLFDRPWNQDADHPRVFDWGELVRQVEEDAND